MRKFFARDDKKKEDSNATRNSRHSGTPSMERTDTLRGDSGSRRILSVNSADTLFGQSDVEYSEKSGIQVSPRSNSYCKLFGTQIVDLNELDSNLIKFKGQLSIGMSPDTINEEYFNSIFINGHLLLYQLENNVQVVNIRISKTTRVTPSVDATQFALIVEGMKPVYLQASTVLLNLKWVSKLAASTL